MKRRGFTLIELMVVIAIIIILAAIAIPNYLKMTERAKKSRIASEFATLAIALESYNTDWGHYPTMAAADLSSGTEITGELSGGTGAAINVTGQSTSTGEGAPIVYMGAGSLAQMTNPLVTNSEVTGHYYKYISNGEPDTDNATTWLLYAYDGTTWYYRTSIAGSLQQTTSAAPTAPAAL